MTSNMDGCVLVDVGVGLVAVTLLVPLLFLSTEEERSRFLETEGGETIGFVGKILWGDLAAGFLRGCGRGCGFTFKMLQKLFTNSQVSKNIEIS